MHFFVFLFVVIFVALPLILLTSYVEFSKQYNLFDVTADLLKSWHPIPRYVALGVFLALIALAYILLARGML